MPDFLPRRDLDLLHWSANLAEKLAADPEAYGFTPQRVAPLQALQAAFAARLSQATNPTTRTASAIAGKDAARAAMAAEIRRLVAILRAIPAVTHAMQIDLGLRPRKRSYSRIGAPALAPRVGVVSVTGQVVRIRLRNAAPSRSLRALPRGVVGARIYVHLGDESPKTIEAWRFYRTTTRTVLDIDCGYLGTQGVTLWITAQWVSPRGAPGPSCDPVYVRLAGAWAVPVVRSLSQAA